MATTQNVQTFMRYTLHFGANPMQANTDSSQNTNVATKFAPCPPEQEPQAYISDNLGRTASRGSLHYAKTIPLNLVPRPVQLLNSICFCWKCVFKVCGLQVTAETTIARTGNRGEEKTSTQAQLQFTRCSTNPST